MFHFSVQVIFRLPPKQVTRVNNIDPNTYFFASNTADSFFFAKTDFTHG